MEDLAYCAGFFDGEGSVRLLKRRGRRASYMFGASITNTYRPVLEKFEKQFGGAVTLNKSITNPAWRPQGVWQITGPEAYLFLERIRPWLIEKKPQVELALEFYRARRRLPYHLTSWPEGDEMVARVHALKKQETFARG